MSRRLVYLDQALRDLGGIADWHAEQTGDIARAEAFVGRLRARSRKLASNPAKLGRVRDDLGLELRSIAYQGYVIFFRYAQRSLEVVRVAHGARDLGAMFKDEPD